MNQQGRNNMGMFMFLYLCAALFAGIGMWHYSQSEDSAFHKTLGLCRSCEADVKRHEEKITKQEEELKSFSVKLTAAEEQVKKFQDELNIFRDQVGETRERQIQLKDDLSNKTQRILLPKGPIPIEIYVSKTARAVIPNGPPKQQSPPPKQQAPPPTKPDKATLNKLKKQIEGLSK